MKIIRYVIAALSTLLLTSTILLFDIPLPNTYAYYHEGNLNLPTETGIFQGDIKQNHDFVQGEIPSSNDFTISGTMKSDTKVYKAKDLTIQYLGIIGIVKVGDFVAINVRVQSKENSKEGCSFSINVKVVKANQALSCSLDGKIFYVTEDFITIDNTTIPFDQSVLCTVKDSKGNGIEGTINYSNNLKQYALGKNIVTYVFTPKNRNYPVKKGSFIVNYIPSYTLSATTLYMQTGTAYCMNVKDSLSPLELTYTTSNQNVVSINPSTGQIKAIREGNDNIIVTVTDKSNHTQKKYLVYVSVGNYDQIVSLDKKNLTLKTGSYYDLNIKTAYSGSDYYFEASNSNIEVFNPNGITRAIRKGESSIICTFTTENRTAYLFKCDVTVN